MLRSPVRNNNVEIVLCITGVLHVSCVTYRRTKAQEKRERRFSYKKKRLKILIAWRMNHKSSWASCRFSILSKNLDDSSSFLKSWIFFFWFCAKKLKKNVIRESANARNYIFFSSDFLQMSEEKKIKMYFENQLVQEILKKFYLFFFWILCKKLEKKNKNVFWESGDARNFEETYKNGGNKMFIFKFRWFVIVLEFFDHLFNFLFDFVQKFEKNNVFRVSVEEILTKCIKSREQEGRSWNEIAEETKSVFLLFFHLVDRARRCVYFAWFPFN